MAPRLLVGPAVMRTRKSRANKTRRTGGGFSTIELIVAISVVTIVSAFGLMGISRAKAGIRLSGAAREYASYVEKARTFSIRSHADDATERATITINDSKTSYTVTMDLDGDGDMDTRTIPLPDGVTFDTVESIGFDWRGRTWNTVGASTTSNAQVSITLKNSSGTVSVDVTGSGDVTVDSKVFDDSVPNINLKVGTLVSSATPVSTPAGSETATPSPSPTATPASTNPSPTPTPTPAGTTPLPTPTPTATPTPTPAPTATPTPTPSPTPSPSPTPVTCSITVDQLSVIMANGSSTTIKVTNTSSTSVSVSANSSKSSDLQVTPNQAQTISAGSSVSFTIKAKKTGVYSVTISSSCATKVIPVVILL